jgi:hypothetical protein
MANAYGSTFIWVMGITAAALLPTLMLARIERRARRGDADPAAPARPRLPEPETRELAWESA